MIPWILPVVSFFILTLPENVVPMAGTIYEYDTEDFKRHLKDMDGNFVLFYAPWCRHCTEFEPIWKELAELVNTKESSFVIAQVDCTRYPKLCHENDITGYPTLLYFKKDSLTPIEYKGLRDLPSLTLFLSEVFTMHDEIQKTLHEKEVSEVKIHNGMAYLDDFNIEKFVSKGQHFVMFFSPWCSASQRLAPIWAELGEIYSQNEYIQIGQVNCMRNEMTCKNFDIKQFPYMLWIVNGRIVSAYVTMGISVDGYTLNDLTEYVERMLLAENHDPEKFMKKKKALPVARITEETFETFLQKDLVFVNYFAPWCAHCMQLSPLWLKLGEKFQNESRVLIADVDCVRSKTVCEMEKINGLPTLILYKNKEIVSLENGGRPLESLVTLVNEHLNEQSSDTSEITLVDDETSDSIQTEAISEDKSPIEKDRSKISIENSDEIIIQTVETETNDLDEEAITVDEKGTAKDEL